MAGDAGQSGINDQARAVLHQPMPDEAQFCLHARPLPIKPGIGVGRAAMGFIGPFSPRKSPGGLRPPPLGPLFAGRSFGLKLFIEAQASINVPSTEKCSLDNSRLTRGRDNTADRNLAAMSPANNRSRFFEKLEWSHTGSSIPRPTNQRNSRSNSICSINWRSERTE